MSEFGDSGSGVEPAEDGVGRLSREPVHLGRVLDLGIDTVRFPDGSEGQLELAHHRGASAVLPLFGDLDDPDPEVLLVRQYRYAAGGFIYEVPAGMPDYDGEPWDDCARRELEEETGWVAARLVPLTRIFTTPGFTDEVIRLYVGLDLTPGRTQRDDDEFLDVVRLRFSEVMEMVRQGQIVDCKSLATLLYASAFVIGRGEPA